MTPEDFTSTILPLRTKCYRFAASMLRNGQESEDVAQEVMIKLWDRRDTLQHIDNVEAWAIRATRNMAIDRMRHSSWRTGDVEVLYAHASSALSADERVEQQEAVEAVFTEMNALPELQRSILHLREVEQKTYEEIATTLQLSDAQVKVYLHRARKKIRESIDQSHAPSSNQRAY